MAWDPESLPTQDDHAEVKGRWSTLHRPADIVADIRVEMNADTACILLVDSTRVRLEMFECAGLDRAARGTRPVRIGEGFIGAIAQSRQPAILPDTDAATVHDPVLVNLGVRSLAGVPIMAESELLGVLHVGRRQSRAFTEADIVELTGLAKELAGLLRRMRAQDGHTAALALQRSLLPLTFRVPDSIEVAVRYIPASGDLGGDWYDVFELPDRRVVVVMGDVVGHGFEAAIVMGRLRSALRSYAIEHDDPATILRQVDTKITYFEPGKLATILLGISEPPYTDWVFSCAGHPAPIIGLPGEQSVSAQLPIDTLIGYNPETPRHNTTVALPEGGTLCLFTDGLIERRPTSLDGNVDILTENTHLVCKNLTGAEDPEAACIQILSEVIGDRTAEDDIALLVARVRPADAGGGA